MSKPIVLMDYIERRKKTGSITVDLGGDKGTIVIPPQEVWPDEVFDTAISGKTKEAVELLLGQDASDRFHAAGGNYRMLGGIVREQQGLTVPQSEASPDS